MCIRDRLDVGQAVITQQDRVLAIEAAEGTQEMIARATHLIDNSTDAAVFVKMTKSHQHKVLDMPVIGIKTLQSLAQAGIAVVGIAAGHTMLADTLEAIEAELSAHDMVLTTDLDLPDDISADRQTG